MAALTLPTLVKTYRRPQPNREQIEAIAREGLGLVDLWDQSPIRLDTAESSTEDIIDALFPSDSLLCCGKNFCRAFTKPRKAWRGRLSDYQFIVPSPMKSLSGMTQRGKTSSRALSAVGDRRFLVIECDFACSNTATVEAAIVPGYTCIDLCAAILLHLAERAPLAMAVHSGNMSLHGWFFCLGQPEEQLNRFMAQAVSLGADPATWTPCQFVRMPDGVRENESRQWVFFFNPGVVK